MARVRNSCMIAISGVVLAGIAPAVQAQQLQTRPPLRPTLQTDLQVQQVPTQVVPPEDVESYDDPQSVTLRPGPSSALVSTLGVRRAYSVETLRRQPELQLGPVRADMRPVLQNPAAPVNVASRLRQQSALVSDVHDTFEVVEAGDGLLIRQFLTYRMRPGACSDRGKRLAVSRAGATCFSRMSEAQRQAARADPDNVRHASGDTIRLANRTLAARRAEEAEQIASDIARLRAMLRDPAERAAIEAEIGASETARLDRLDDDGLEAEVVNMGEFQLEEIMYVPANDSTRPVFLQRPRFGLAGPSLARIRPQLVQPVEIVDFEHDIATQTYLTGFTLNRSHEWRKRVSITINWCVVSCKKTYYIETSAGFEYGFGLRLPIAVDGTYRYDRVGNDEHARFTARIAPINATADQFENTALPADQIFNGQELVAEVGARAGLAYKVPVMGTNSVGAAVTHDFAAGLPAPFTNGQFTPPRPGDPSPPSADKVFRNIDLIGGRADFWFVGAKIHPAIRLGLTSDRLEMQLRDNISGSSIPITQPEQTFDLAIDPATHASNFTIADPVYNLGFTLTPGITATVFVDIKAWSDEWDWPIWFPQLSVTLPPAGRDFGCHAETICSYSYNYSPDLQQETAAQASLPSDPIEARAEQWKREFTPYWQSRCPEEDINWCDVAINSLATTYRNRMVNRMQAAVERLLPHQWDAELNSIFATETHEAAMRAEAVIEESVARAEED